MGKEALRKNSSQLQVFVNRKDELLQLTDVLNTVIETESPKTISVSGTSGIGKTSFVNHFLNSCRGSSDIVIMHVSGYAVQTSPLLPFVKMIENFKQEYKDISKLVLSSITNILRFFPEVSRSFDLIEDTAKLWSKTGTNDKFSISNANVIHSNYISTINHLSKKKIVILCIDDAQWLDATSFELLEQIIHHVTGKLLLLLSYVHEPTDDKEIENNEKIERLVHIHSDDSNSLCLNSLDEKNYPQIIDSVLQGVKIEKSNMHSLYVETQGNPYYLKDILHLYKESDVDKNCFGNILKHDTEINNNLIPKSMSYTLCKRLKKTYQDIEDSETVLMYAAVFGYRFNSEILSQILGEKQLKIFLILKKIKENFFLIDNPQHDKWFEFDHKITQNSILFSNSPMIKEIHKEIAEFYEKSKKDPFVLSYHYIKSDNWEMAIKYLKDASKISLDNCFFSDAVTKYEQCLDILKNHDLDILSEVDICSIKTNYSRALLETGDVDKSMKNLNELASNEYISYEDKAETYLLLSKGHRLKGIGNKNRDLSIDFAEKSCNMLEKNKSEKLGKTYSYLATVYDHFGQYPKAEKNFSKALKCYQNNPLELSILHRKSGMVLQPRRAIKSMEKALVEFEKNNMMIEKARCLNNIGAENFFIGEFDNASKYLGHSMELFRKLGSPEIYNPINNTGLLHLQKKNYTKALQFFNDAMGGLTQIYSEMFIKMNLATTYRKQNNIKEALNILSDIEPDIVRYSEEVLNDYYGFNRASTHYELGQYEDAKIWIEKYPINNYKKDVNLALAKRQSLISSICEKMNDFDEAVILRNSSVKLFETQRLQKWFYQTDYYPCDLHILD